jgi:hypothetical protein
VRKVLLLFSALPALSAEQGIQKPSTQVEKITGDPAFDFCAGWGYIMCT